MSSEIHPSWFSLHARLACVDRRKMYTRDLYGRFKALESLVLFFLLEIKWKKQIYNINWFSMLQNRICSQVNTQEPTLTQTQTAPTPPPPPLSPHHLPFFRPYKEPNILTSLLICMPIGWWTFKFFSFFHFSPVSPFVHFKAVFYNQQKVHLTFLTTMSATV